VAWAEAPVTAKLAATRPKAIDAMAFFIVTSSPTLLTHSAGDLQVSLPNPLSAIAGRICQNSMGSITFDDGRLVKSSFAYVPVRVDEGPAEVF
jgi:hypothetical protein